VILNIVVGILNESNTFKRFFLNNNVLLQNRLLFNLKILDQMSIVPIIQTPERIQLKYRLNISQQNLHIMHVMSGDEVTYSSIAKSSSRSYLLRNN
jgi:hypothetical protein